MDESLVVSDGQEKQKESNFLMTGLNYCLITANDTVVDHLPTGCYTYMLWSGRGFLLCTITGNTNIVKTYSANMETHIWNR